MKKSLNVWALVGITYGLVLATSVLAVASYFYFRSEVKPGDDADGNQMRRMMVGAVWVPIYSGATYVEPAMVQQKEITTGSVKFRSKDPAGAVLGFYQGSLKEGGFVTFTEGNAGGTVQAVRNGGKTNVTVSVTTGPENTTGEIRTLHRADPARPNK
jgi:cytochrome c-type biogenesis protein CcmE